MKIHREGFRIIPVSGLILASLLYAFYILTIPIWILVILGSAALVVFILIVRFFRDPRRESKKDSTLVYSPCDGKVVVIEEVEEPEYFGDRRIQISIFMSPLNVHVNRNPVAGKVSYFKYHPGKYLVAWHPKSSTENERTTVVVKTESGNEVLFRQIAGAVARRIRWYLNEEDSVEQGAEMGFIKFGSRVDLLLPPDAEVLVNIGDKVQGALSKIASLPYVEQRN
jgi:phosphatidylserine decarboxylase